MSQVYIGYDKHNRQMFFKKNKFVVHEFPEEFVVRVYDEEMRSEKDVVILPKRNKGVGNGGVSNIYSSKTPWEGISLGDIEALVNGVVENVNKTIIR